MSSQAAGEPSSYVSGFEEDLFISYAHIDNEREEWITQLHTKLKVRLKELLGTSSLRIWRDLKLSGSDPFNELLEQKASNSALFLSVLSPRYVVSESCKSEVNWFLRGASRNSGIRVGTTARILKVHKTSLQGASEPEGLQKAVSLGWSFYKEEENSFVEFSANPGIPTYPDFDRQCDLLAQAINHLLRKMSQDKRADAGSSRQKTIFLAETTKEFRSQLESIRIELTDRGHRVLPDVALNTDDSEELQSAIRAVLPLCDVSIHMLGKSYGKVPEGENTRSIAHLEYDWVRDQPFKRAFQQIVWIPEDLKDPEPRQQNLLENIQNIKDGPGTVKMEVFKTGFESFKDGLLDILKKDVSVAVPLASGLSKNKSIYLICDQRDLAQPEFQAIRRFFADRGNPIDLPAFEGDPGELREAEQLCVRESDATLIYYGQAKDLWIKNKRDALRKALAESGKQNTRAVYLSSPESDVKKGVYVIPGGMLLEPGGFSPLLVLGDCGPFASEKLHPLLQRLEEEVL